MIQNANSLSLTPDNFKANFAAIAPLILAEWSIVSPDSLHATTGELEQVVDCIATATDRTRILVRRQLSELYQIGVLEARQPKALHRSELFTQLINGSLSESDLKETINRLEQRTEALLTQFKQEVLPELNEKVRNHVGGSLLTALGIGFILGLLLGGSRGR